MPGGRPRKLREQHILDGTYRPSRDKKTINGELITELPETSVPMSDKAYQYFNSIAKKLINIGVLNDTDILELEIMSYEFGCFWEYELKQKKLSKKIKYINDKIDIAHKKNDNAEVRFLSGKHKRLIDELKLNIKQRNSSLDKGMKISSKFGLNPIERQKLSVKPLTVESDPFKDF